MNPKDIQVPVPSAMSVALYGNEDIAAVIKQKILKWGYFPRLTKWTLYIIIVFYNRETEGGLKTDEKTKSC